MLYKYLFELSSHFHSFNLFQYITFRSFLAFFTAFFVCWFLGYLFIARSKNLGEKIREDGPPSHHNKTGTPTMGGIFILVGLLVSCFLWIDFFEPLVLAVLTLVLGFACIGFYDDYLKLKQLKARGLKAATRFSIEMVFSGIVLSILIRLGYLDTSLHFPVFKNLFLDLGVWYVLFGSVVITGCANAVNLTDGLDGLAIFPLLICAGTLAIFSYVAGHAELANYLNIPFIPGSGELTPLLAAVVAGGLGFLWFNSYPAQVFMGDVGSLSLGSLIGTVAVLTKNELLLVILGGVFVVEAFSVIIQVVSFKLTGNRLFQMAPLHHHFELKGMKESKIIIRFWIISILLAVFSLMALKVR